MYKYPQKDKSGLYYLDRDLLNVVFLSNLNYIVYTIIQFIKKKLNFKSSKMRQQVNIENINSINQFSSSPPLRFIKRASHADICKEFLKFSTCSFKEKLGFSCPYAHTILEI